ncbi:hypothetical protein DWZ56_16495 [Lachnotalea sp. AF33-28]|nr:hypothetical protein DWZ56_16495 [Lachnotalea sp. AF33-28]
MRLHVPKAARAPKKITDINELKPVIEDFLRNAYAQNYFVPNRVIPKQERPKRRFHVRAYIKELQTVSMEGEGGKTAAELLEKLYLMLCYACCYYIFSTEDPFRSVGIDQSELLDIVLRAKFAYGIDHEMIKSAIMLVTNPGLDRQTLYHSLIAVLVFCLKTADSKEIAIQEAKKRKVELAYEAAQQAGKKKNYNFSNDDYWRKEEANILVEIVFCLYIKLGDYDTAIEYFKKNIQESTKEIELYVLLEKLFIFDLNDYFIREYEAGVKKGIKPREKLQKVYKYTVENGELPQYFW